MSRTKKTERDLEQKMSNVAFAKKLRRLADCIEGGKQFRIQLAGERISVPPDAVISIEHERGKTEEEIEFQLKWPVEG